MKRFISYIFTLILATFFIGAIVYAIWYIANGDASESNYEDCQATITQALAPEARVKLDEGIFKSEYRLTYIQFLKLEYNYNGKKYSQSGDYALSTEYYDQKPLTTGKPSHYYRQGDVITIHVMKSDPRNVEITNWMTSKNIPLKTVVLYASPVYVLIMILFIASFHKKEKEIKKEKFYKKMGMREF